MKPARYIFDTSSFIELGRTYPPDIHYFHTLWEHIERLISTGRLITHEYVLRELTEKDDAMSRKAHAWKKTHPSFIRKPTPTQFTHVRRIVNTYPKLAAPSKKNPYHADPFIIALALEEKDQARLHAHTIIIVCEETYNPEKPLEQNRINIPRVARAYGIETIPLLTFIKREDTRTS